jgi:hypothetical protein
MINLRGGSGVGGVGQLRLLRMILLVGGELNMLQDSGV